MIIELCRTDLFKVVEKFGPIADQQLVIGIFYQLLSAVKTIHDKNIAHLDIKPDNIFISQDFTLKLGDFGLSQSSFMPITYKVGTRSYMAPEIFNSPCSFDGVKADIFALGVVLYVMIFGVPPFNEARLECPYYKLRCLRPDWFFKRHPVTKNQFNDGLIEDDLQQILLKMLSPETERPSTIAEVLSHQFFAKQKPQNQNKIKTSLIKLIL